MTQVSDLIALPDAARALPDVTGGPTKPYSAIYKACLDGRIPVVRGDNGRYALERSKLSDIARALGLPVLPQFVKRSAA